MTTIALSLLFAVQQQLDSDVKTYPNYGFVGAAIIDGRWSRAKVLLDDLKMAGKVPSPKLANYFCNLSGHSNRIGNILTGLRLIKEYGVNVNSDNSSALYSAAMVDRWGEVTERMIQYGADVNARRMIDNLVGNTPIEISVSANPESKALEVLLKHKANANTRMRWFGLPNQPQTEYISPLMTAVVLGRTEKVKLLLQYHADVNQRSSPHNFTALHYAAKFNRYEMVRLLIKHGAKKSARSSKGETPLALARRAKAKEAIRVLS